MADSLIGSLFSTLDNQHIGDIAASLGESEPSILSGIQSSAAAVLGNLVGKADNPSALHQTFDLASSTVGDVTPSSIMSVVSNPSSSLLSGGKRLVSGMFGSNEASVLNAISGQSGIKISTASTLMALAAPLVMSFLGKRVRDEGMSFSALGGLLQRESASIRDAMPSAMVDSVRATTTTTIRGASPVVAQAVQKQKSSWPLALGILALLLGGFWIFNTLRTPAVPRIASADRLADGAAALGDFVKRHLPGNVDLNIPERGVEARFLAFIQIPSGTVDGTTWFDFDRLLFDTDSATLRPVSREQLDNIAAILKAYPNVTIKVGGFTDNVGDPAQNLTLSQDRASSVVAELVAKGISPSRLSAAGYGEQFPIADNSTAEGRARNRRVSMSVTQK